MSVFERIARNSLDQEDLLLERTSRLSFDQEDLLLEPEYFEIDAKSTVPIGYWNSFKRSFRSLTTIHHDSIYIYRQCASHPLASKFRANLRRIAQIRALWIFMVIGMELAMSFPMAAVMTALQDKDEGKFIHNTTMYLLLLIVAVPIMTMDSYIQEKLYLQVREAVSNILLGRYHSNYCYYHMSSQGDKVDNPGQRMDVDVNWWSWGIPNFMTIVMRQILRLLGWSMVLWFIGAQAVFFCFIIAILVVSAAVILFASKLTSIATQISSYSADFRAGIIRTRDNGETIAFYNASEFESHWSLNRLALLLSAKLEYSKYETGLNVLQKCVKYTGAILPLFLLYDQYMNDKLDLGALMQSSHAFAELLKALTLIIDQMSRLSKIQAAGRRVVEVIEAMVEIEEQIANPPVLGNAIAVSTRSQNGKGIKGTSNATFNGVKVSYFENRKESKEDDHEDRVLMAKDLSIIVPNTHSLLLYKLNIAISRNQNLLIVGPSGSGKSSLLRVLSGLWTWGDGQVTRLDDEEVMFLPQRPYLPMLPGKENTLKNQLRFPKLTESGNTGSSRKLTTEKFKETLKALNLSYIARFGQDSEDQNGRDWGKLLSLGEQQRLSFGRAVVAKPKMVYLDEATSALDEENQSRMYRLLQSQNISFVSVGHRANLVEFHDNILEVLGDGSWQMWTREEYVERRSM